MKLEKLNYLLEGTNNSSLYFFTDAYIYNEDNTKIFLFIENTPLKLKTKVIIYNDKVIMLKEGIISSYISFIKNETTKMLLYYKGYSLEMDVTTFDLLITSYGIYVKYQTQIDKENDIIHTLKLTLEK